MQSAWARMHCPPFRRCDLLQHQTWRRLTDAKRKALVVERTLLALALKKLRSPAFVTYPQDSRSRIHLTCQRS